MSSSAASQATISKSLTGGSSGLLPSPARGSGGNAATPIAAADGGLLNSSLLSSGSFARTAAILVIGDELLSGKVRGRLGGGKGRRIIRKV